MKLSKYLVAGGNPTLLVFGKNINQKIIQKYLVKEVDQIGSIDLMQEIPVLTMMGNELCINATLCMAYFLKGAGVLKASCVNSKIRYLNDILVATVIVDIP